jgi:hypothetical protein
MRLVADAFSHKAAGGGAFRGCKTLVFVVFKSEVIKSELHFIVIESEAIVRL